VELFDFILAHGGLSETENPILFGTRWCFLQFVVSRSHRWRHMKVVGSWTCVIFKHAMACPGTHVQRAVELCSRLQQSPDHSLGLQPTFLLAVTQQTILLAVQAQLRANLP
jgi:hypothetical protein